MTVENAEAVARALLYEGYLLYPYRPSAAKNRQRWTFGTLYPRAFADVPDATDAWSMQTECLVRGGEQSTLATRARFLHLVERADDTGLWQEAVERDVAAADRRLGDLVAAADRHAFGFPAWADADGTTRRRQAAVTGLLERRATRVGDAVWKVTVVIRNLTPPAPDVATPPARDRRTAGLLAAFAATHTLLGVRDGEFVSLLDPPEALRAAAAGCRNEGTWPVLVGEPGERAAMLSSPIILYDYPRVAPESPGDLFDATEIDELLALRILTLTDDERRQMAAVDERARRLLQRTEALDGDALLRLHGAVRGLRPAGAEGGALRPGARVRLRPRGGADVLDLALAGRAATIAAIEEDYEGRVFLAVTVDDDPGCDLGARGMVGHRFFFRPEEVEPLS